MERPKIRIGKDFTVLWNIYKRENGVKTPYMLAAGKENYVLRLWTPYGKQDITRFDIDENTIQFDFLGKDQKHLGNYSLELVERNNAIGMVTVDTAGFTLVAYSRYETDGGDSDVVIQDVKLESELGLTPIVSLTIDTEFSETSHNAVSNYVITEKFKQVDDKIKVLQDAVEALDIQSIETAIENKVDKEDGKGLSSNDYTDEEKEKLESAVIKNDLAQYVKHTELADFEAKVVDAKLATKQEQLVSGENIKTINGESILGKGDLVIEGGNPTFVTDFTVNDLYELVYRGAHPVQANIVALQRALENKERIVVPYGTEEYKGYSLLQGYSEDLVYFTVADENGSTYVVEVGLYAGEIDRDNITHVSPKDNKINIADLQNGKVNKTDVATINGKSIINGGNITIEGGEGSLDSEVVSSTEASEEFPQVLYVEQTLTEAQKSQARKNIGADNTELKEQITELSAEIEGKEDRANKTTTLSSASTDTQYPSARATFMAISKKSEVSLEALANGNLKVTIDGVSKDFMAATPSGDPMHYNYIVVGALYNDTDSAIARTDYFGNAVSHLPGRWYVEGLGDLTNAEMREVYEAGKWWENTNDKGFASNIKARAILRCPAFQQVSYKAPFEFKQAFNASANLEVVDLRPSPEIYPTAVFNRTKCSTMDFLCQNSQKVKYIYGIIDASAPVDGNSFWIHTPGLIEVRLYNIKREVKLPQSKAISKASIIYMIENEAVTNSAVITLHADAYARLSADEDIVAALAAHPKVSLAKA